MVDFRKEMKKRKDMEKAIRSAARWMNNAIECLKTPGMGLADASDSVQIALRTLKPFFDWNQGMKEEKKLHGL